MGYSKEEEDEDKLMLFQMDFTDSEPNKPLQPPHNFIYHSLQVCIHFLYNYCEDLSTKKP
jgi:hypothetical protein